MWPASNSKGAQAQAGWSEDGKAESWTCQKAVSNMTRTISKSHVLEGGLMTALTTLCLFSIRELVFRAYRVEIVESACNSTTNGLY
jgi:hypothetical protein